MLTPTTEAELAEAIAGANGPLAIRGGGTRCYGRPVEGTDLTVAGLNGVTLYEPGALTLVAHAGTPLSQVEATLADAGQRLPFEPMDHRPLLGTQGEPTLGGMIAANVSGPRRVQAGAARDFLLGARFVDGAGRIVKSGGRVMKNVTGYDLARLMAGAHGTLGVLTEVSLKVLPDVEAETTLVLGGLDDPTAIAALSAALGSPFEVSGAAHDPDEGRTLLRLEGFAESVRYRAGRLADLLSRFGGAEAITDRSKSRDLWTAIRDVSAFAATDGDVWRLSTKPGDAPALVARASARAVRYDWGGGLVWLLTDPGTDLRAALGPFDGHATLIRASRATRATLRSFHPETPAVASLSAGLRARFDPRGILNPGLMG